MSSSLKGLKLDLLSWAELNGLGNYEAMHEIVKFLAEVFHTEIEEYEKSENQKTTKSEYYKSLTGKTMVYTPDNDAKYSFEVNIKRIHNH